MNIKYARLMIAFIFLGIFLYITIGSQDLHFTFANKMPIHFSKIDVSVGVPMAPLSLDQRVANIETEIAQMKEDVKSSTEDTIKLMEAKQNNLETIVQIIAGLTTLFSTITAFTKKEPQNSNK